MRFYPRDFIHPEDRAALEQLEAVPLFPSAVKAFMRVYPEQFFHGLNMANKIRLGPRQLPRIYDLLPPICARLGMPEPEFYLEQNPVPNAYTYGDTRCFITVTSGLVDLLEEDELTAVLGHECGHIICGHVRYHTMADYMLDIGETLSGPLSPLLLPTRAALYYWYRRSEMSADRVGAVVMGSPKPMIETMVRLSGGSKTITAGVDNDLYMQQAHDYDRLLESKWNFALQTIAVMQQHHPFPSVRSREIARWCATDPFQMYARRYQEESAPSCTGCGRPQGATWDFCGYCGQTRSPATAPSSGDAP